jgi:hypothetical protein
MHIRLEALAISADTSLDFPICRNLSIDYIVSVVFADIGRIRAAAI